MKNWNVRAVVDAEVVSCKFATEHEAEEFCLMLYGRGYDEIDMWRA